MKEESQAARTGLEIAVIGIAGKFPGAKGIDEFWENLRRGVESLAVFSREELEECGIDPGIIDNPNYVKVKGFLEDIEYFDAAFFDYSPREAEIMDPQIRILHECSWRALEDAGYDPWSYSGVIGFYAGAAGNFNWVSLSPLAKGLSDPGGLEAGTLCYKDAISTLIAYKLNLQGPSFTLYTACSTSLLAIHLASRALLTGECNLALAGGAAVSYPKKSGYFYHEGMILSPDGHVRTFDAEARGTVFGDGAGIVVLKRLDEAWDDGDHIYAVIKASAVNNDGERKVGYTAPSVEGQAEVIRKALHMAEVDLESIGYIEVHGTGTRVGDPIEIAALKRIFAAGKKAYCALGTVKTNIGHLDTAAGVAGFIKTVLALKHGLIPPTLNFEQPNPEMDLIDSAFYINTEPVEWTAVKGPLRAGVSAFGLGGTNVHVVLENIPYRCGAAEDGEPQLLPLSAKSERALEQLAEDLAGYLERNPGIPLADVAYTLQMGRHAFAYRRVELCRRRCEAVQALGQKKAPAEALKPGNNPLIQTANQWVKGANIDWQSLYKERKGFRVTLPGHPLAGKRFWLEAPSPRAPLEEEEPLSKYLPKNEELAEWFSLPDWELSPLALPVPRLENRDRDTWLIFNDEPGLGVRLQKELEKKGHPTIGVRKGEKFGRLSEREYTLDPRQDSHYRELLAELSSLDRFPRYIVHLWNVNGAAEEPGQSVLDSGFYSLVYLAQAVGKQNVTGELYLTVITDNMQKVTGEESLCPEKAAVIAVCQSLPQEYPNFYCRSIDIVTPGTGKEQEHLVRCLSDEMRGNTRETVVAYRNNCRWLRIFKPLPGEFLEAPLALREKDAAPRLREKGVYLITGGLGVIGTRLAKYLAGAVRAKLVLTGRQAFPRREEWERWLADDRPGEVTRRRIQRVRELETLGAEVLVLTADVGDEDQMRRVVQQAEARFGQIHGVIHGAGYLHRKSAFCLLENLDRDLCEAHFRSKMIGLQVLEKVLPGKGLDFCLMISSLSPILGGLGFTAYAAANLYMDAYIHWHNRTKAGGWQTVNWGDWQSDETGSPGPALGASLANLEMTAAEGVKTFQCVLALKDFAQVVISAGDLHSRIRQWIKPAGGQNKRESRQAAKGTPPEIAAGDVETVITRIWLDLYRVESVDKEANFFDLGATSLDLIQIHGKLIKTLGRHMPFDVFLEYPTIRSLSEYLRGEEPAQATEIQGGPARESKAGLAGSSEVAVIGMAGRFPGAGNTGEFWENLVEGRETISFFSDQELQEAGLSPGEIDNPGYIKAKGFLAGTEYFDAGFFDYAPGDAEIMDPQMRIFHECVWEALEDAGYDPKTYPGSIGLYGGATPNLYWEVLSQLSRLSDAAGQFSNSLLYDKDSLATQVSYKLDLKGPSLTLFTGCSTSLVAIASAYRALVSGQCHMAAAGGVTVTLPEKSGYIYQAGMLFSADGHCRSFDAKASGMIFGDGAGVVVLKPLPEAIRDGDNIHAVIKGSAVNNDGSRKIGYTSPSVKGQVEVIKAAHHLAGIEPESIAYVETHGTGTILGDPIEINALTQAFNTGKKHFCPIGSVKSNTGHMMCASGVAGFIKTILSLKYHLIPPSLNFAAANPQIDFANSPFYVNTTVSRWESNGTPLRAGVSSFGIGGTNAHLILEQAPELPPSSGGREGKMFLFSAKTETALERTMARFAGHLEKNPGIDLADAAYTLQVGRRALNHRAVLVCSTREEVIEALLTGKSIKVKRDFPRENRSKIVFMFAGQGAQYVEMGRELYEKEPVFREALEQGFAWVKRYYGSSLKELLYPHSPSSALPAAAALAPTAVAQPVIFIFEYALARLLMKWGIQPWAMIGYSFGEYVAAHLAGVFSLEDAIKLIVRRGELMNRLPPGAMLSVPLPEDRLKPVLEECALPLSLAIDNGSSCIVAGSQEVVEVFQEQMKQKKLMCFRVPIAHAAHSLALDTILEEYEQHVGTVTLNKPGIPLISNITGTWLTPEQAVSPAYWVQHLRETVRFARGLEALIEEPGTIFLEIGPGRDLSVIVNRFLGSQPHRTVHTIRQPQKKVSDVFFLLNKIAHLWACGVKIDWNGFYDGERRYRISLPPYPFEGQRYRLKGNPLEMVTEQLSASRPHRREAIDDWFYFPSWKRVPLAPPTGESEPGRSGPGWLFINHRGCRLSSGLKNLLESKGHQVTTVEPGTCLERLEPGRYRLNPQQSNDYIRLVEELGRRDKIPGTIVHLWSVFDAGEEIAPFTPKDLGFYSLLYLAQAIGGQNITTKIEIIVVSSDMQEVTGGDLKCPAKATLLGPCQVIPREYPQISCRSIDIVTPGSGGEPDQEAELSETINHLFKEFSSKSPERPTAYRNNYRWLQTFEPISLREVPPSGLPVKQGGVYLITGGLGGIGFSLARHLAQAVQAKLILTGRSGFPAKEEWEQWVALHRQEEPLSRKVRDLMELEAQGAEILVFSTDVTDRQQMGEVISRAEERLGPIDGVIHAAGVPGGGMIQIKKKSAAETVFAPKITGTLVLDDIFRGRALDFFIICSSTASFLGLFGQVDYTGANAFLDAFAFYRTSRDGVLTTAINWYDWQEVGMAVEAARQYAGRLDISLEEGIRPAEGIEAFNRVLVAQLPQVVVAPKDLDLLIKESDTARRVKNRLDHLEQADRPVCRHRRPDLDVPYREPRGEIQQVLANTLQEFLGIENVGIHDDFFDLGGDSLKAISVVSRIHKELNVEIPLAKFFQVPTVELLAGYIGTQEQSRYSSMEAVEEKEYYRLSSAQKRLYVIYQINPLSTAYNEFFAVSLEGALDRERVKGALIRVLKRHESFRTSFEIIADEPIQKIHSQVSLEVEYIDLAAVMTGDSDTGPDRPGKAKTLIKNFIRPFELARAPILRVGLIRQGYNRHILMIDLHHIITDGVSDNIFVNDFMVLYSGGEPPPLRVQYKDYAEWQRTAAQREVMARQESYWLNRFTGRLPVLDLPTDFARPLLQSFEGSWLSSGIGRELTGKIKTLALEKETTLYIVLLAVYTILLSKYTGQADIIVGSPITGRIHTDVQNTIGMFVNMLAMRSFPVESKDFSAFLAEVKENSLQAFENQQYQFEELVIKLGLQGKTSRNPLFDVVFALQNMGMGNVEINDLKVFPYESEIKGAQFDFLLIASETGDTIDLILEFSTALFKKATMEKFLQRYIEILQQVVDSREIKLADLQFSRDLADIAAVSPEAEAGDFGF